jgi:hypothetical protein
MWNWIYLVLVIVLVFILIMLFTGSKKTVESFQVECPPGTRRLDGGDPNNPECIPIDDTCPPGTIMDHRIRQCIPIGIKKCPPGSQYNPEKDECI